MRGHDDTTEAHALLQYLRPAETLARVLKSDGGFPNNPRLPLLAYRGAFRLPDTDDPAAIIEAVFAANGWGGGWRNGVHTTHHYHSTAHEVLGCYSGRARLQFGGPGGVVVEAGRGDVLVLPAGTAHRNMGSSDDFAVVGGYPDGQTFDMNYGRPGERPGTDGHIARTPLPSADPVYGSDGPLMRHWS